MPTTIKTINRIQDMLDYGDNLAWDGTHTFNSNIILSEDGLIGIGVSDERIVFDGSADALQVLDANIGIGRAPTFLQGFNRGVEIFAATSEYPALCFSATDHSERYQWGVDSNGKLTLATDGTTINSRIVEVNANGEFRLTQIDTQTTTNVPALVLQHRLSGANVADVGMGVSLEFELETDAGGTNYTTAGEMQCVWTDATDGSESADYVWQLVSNGSTAEKMRLTSSGNVYVASGLSVGKLTAPNYLIDGKLDQDAPTYLFINNANNTSNAESGVAISVGAEPGFGDIVGYFVAVPDNYVDSNFAGHIILSGGTLDILTAGGFQLYVDDLGSGQWKLSVDGQGIVTNRTTGANERGFLSEDYSANASSAGMVFYKSRNTTFGSHTAVQAGDSCGIISAYGSDGINFDEVARISLRCDSISGGNIGGDILFQTATSGGVLTDRMVIDEDGNVGIGTMNPVKEFDIYGDIIMTGSSRTLYSGHSSFPTRSWLQLYSLNEGNSILNAYNAVILNAQVDAFPTDPILEVQKKGITKLLVDTNGDTGIGTTNPGARLDIKGSTNDGSTNVLTWQDSDGANLGVIDTNGNVGINDTSPSTRLSVDGDCSITETVITGGSRIHKITRETVITITLDDTDEIVIVDTDSGTITVNLPAGTNGQHYRISNSGISGNDVIISPDGLQKLFGANADFLLHDGETIDIYFQNTEHWL